MSTISNKYFNTFGEAFSFAIDLNRLSQSDFAEKWGKDRGQVSKYVNNVSMPRPQNIKEIEELLNVRFLNENSLWSVIEEKRSQDAIDSVNSVREEVTRYKEKELTLDDIPELVRLKKEIEERIAKLIK